MPASCFKSFEPSPSSGVLWVMALFIIGAGLSAEYLTLRALRLLGMAEKVYVDSYTSIAPGVDVELLRRLFPHLEVVVASRRMLEDEAHRIIEEARERDIAVLVPGDPFTATTHVALRVEAARRGVRVVVAYGVSGVQAVAGAAGLQFYRFGRSVTLVYPEEYYKPYTVVEVVWENMDRNLHTLVLLDLRLDEGKAMTIPEAVRILLELEEEYARREGVKPRISGARLVGVARAGLPDERCVWGTPEEVASASYPPPPHSLVVLAPRLHPMEEEALNLFCRG